MHNIQTLTVYLGSSGHTRDIYRQAAIDLGREIAAAGKHLVYGGMDAGLMGLLAQNALKAGGQVTGIIPDKLKDSERILGGLSNEVHVENLAERKRLMFLRADAVISLPGGFGTLDESLEVLYWANLGSHNKPLVLVNADGYWDALVAYLKTLPDFNPDFLIVVDHVSDIFAALDGWQPPSLPNDGPHALPHFEDEIEKDPDAPLIFDTPSIESSYFLITALGLKQLGKHIRPIGLLNTNGQYDALLDWFQTAHQERFITDKCLTLFDDAPKDAALHNLLSRQKAPDINLHTEKWGERRETPRD